MGMHDPVANMLTIIRNGQQANHPMVTMGSSRLLEQIVRVLKEEGYVVDYQIVTNDRGHKQLQVELKYYRGRPVIERIKRISRPGLRIYRSVKELKPIAGFGVAILSTSKGVMTHIQAKSNGVGGEVLCEVA